METTLVIILVAIGIAAVAFYTGHLRGVATTLKSTRDEFVKTASAHGSLADELKWSRDQLRALLFKPSKNVTESIAAAAAAVSEAAPPPDPDAQRKAVLAQQIADAQAELSKLAKS